MTPPFLSHSNAAISRSPSKLGFDPFGGIGRPSVTARSGNAGSLIGAPAVSALHNSSKMSEERRILTQDSYQLRQIWLKMTTGGNRWADDNGAQNSAPTPSASADNGNGATDDATPPHTANDILLFQNIRNRLRTFTACCNGSDVIRWLLVNDVVSARSQALAIGQALVDAGYLERVSPVDDSAYEADGGVFFSEDDMFKRGKLGREMLAYATDDGTRPWSTASTAESASAETRSIGGRMSGGVTTLRGQRGGDGTVVG